MMLMGAQGSRASYEFAKKIAKLKLPAHLLVCLGKNEELKSKINKIKFNSNISVTTIGFTSRISDLMAASDLILTKPGPNSISEAMYMNLPMILDGSTKILFWEKLNIKLVKANKLGLVVDRY